MSAKSISKHNGDNYLLVDYIRKGQLKTKQARQNTKKTIQLRTNDRSSERTNERTNERTKRTNERSSERTNERNKRTNKQTNERTIERTNEERWNDGMNE